MRKKGEIKLSMIAVRYEVAADMQQERSPWEALSVLASFRSCTDGRAVLMGRDTLAALGALGRSARAVVVESNRAGAAFDSDADRGARLPGGRGGRGLHLRRRGVLRRGPAAVPEDMPRSCCAVPREPVRSPGCGRKSLVAVGREELPHGTPPVTLTVFEKVARLEPNADRAELCRKGSEALQRRLFFLARQCFEQAQSLGDSAELASDLALCRAKSGGDLRTALAAAAEALRREPDNLRCL